MKITILGGAGFIGTNLILKLAANKKNELRVVDIKKEYFDSIYQFGFDNVSTFVSPFNIECDFDSQIEGSDIVYHLASTNIPTTSNYCISKELESNVIVTAKLLDSCVKNKVKKVVFISSGGTVYGKNDNSPISEESSTYPINSYGLQKLTIEKMLYLYYYQFGLDYRVVRLANPYGPYQRPNGQLGVVTTFVYHALTDHKIEVYGDGSVVRDFIYIDDAIEGIVRICDGNSTRRVFNLGSGIGTSINQIINAISQNVYDDIDVIYKSARKADVPVNYLDISQFQKIFGPFKFTSLEEGIKKTAVFLNEHKY